MARGWSRKLLDRQGFSNAAGGGGNIGAWSVTSEVAPVGNVLTGQTISGTTFQEYLNRTYTPIYGRK